MENETLGYVKTCIKGVSAQIIVTAWMCVCVCEERLPAVCALCWRIDSFTFRWEERERNWWYQALALQRGMDRGGNGEMEINGSSEDKGV